MIFEFSSTGVLANKRSPICSPVLIKSTLSITGRKWINIIQNGGNPLLISLPKTMLLWSRVRTTHWSSIRAWNYFHIIPTSCQYPFSCVAFLLQELYWHIEPSETNIVIFNLRTCDSRCKWPVSVTFGSRYTLNWYNAITDELNDLPPNRNPLRQMEVFMKDTLENARTAGDKVYN